MLLNPPPLPPSHPPQPWLYVVRLLLCLFCEVWIMARGFKGDRCTNLPLDHHLFPWICLYRLFSYRLWTKLHGLSFTILHAPSVVIPFQFSEIKLLENARVISQFVYFIDFHMMLHQGREKRRRNDHFRELAMRKWLISSVHVRPKCNLERFPAILK